METNKKHLFARLDSWICDKLYWCAPIESVKNFNFTPIVFFLELHKSSLVNSAFQQYSAQKHSCRILLILLLKTHDVIRIRVISQGKGTLSPKEIQVSTIKSWNILNIFTLFLPSKDCTSDLYPQTSHNYEKQDWRAKRACRSTKRLVPGSQFLN